MDGMNKYSLFYLVGEKSNNPEWRVYSKDFRGTTITCDSRRYAIERFRAYYPEFPWDGQWKVEKVNA